ncbi:hypothetical protein JNUCC31_06560 [Paenibacillus sp. JNUCC31]|uniref:hypothetical protein n=1 Tax=Paenibacillus sp. JNUCC-31 TaxID=2777983 RepID=UPI001784339B|nr:hypothetical protein [Paenibacillus sp. JNUCC-31]QOS80561.1 hypothetical protein JNUCC31_06560 [Paenibacillus sp. JNUCC-31]
MEKEIQELKKRIGFLEKQVQNKQLQNKQLQSSNILRLSLTFLTVLVGLAEGLHRPLDCILEIIKKECL